MPHESMEFVFDTSQTLAIILIKSQVQVIEGPVSNDARRQTLTRQQKWTSTKNTVILLT